MPHTLAEIESLKHRAHTLLRARRLREAIAAFQALLAAAPRLADDWYNLGYLQQAAHQFDDALRSYDRALALQVGRPEEVHLNKAAIFVDYLARPREAEAELNIALALNDQYLPALIHLARVMEQLGRRAEARALYERALRLNPDDPLALSRLAGLDTVRNANHPLVDGLRRALADSRHTLSQRAEVGFSLGKVLDDIEAYDEAFAAYVFANHASRESAGSHWKAYDRDAHEAWIGRLSAQGRAIDATSREADEPSPRMVFICGMFRSGSTLIEAILGAHPTVTAGGELHLLPKLAHDPHAGFHAGRAADPGWLPSAREEYLGAAAAMFPEAKVLTDKRPDNFLRIGLIKQLFPDAKIVNTVRDPLDNCLSVFFTHLDPSLSYALNLLDIAHWYSQYQRLMEAWKDQFADDILDVAYEDLIADPRREIERLLRFVGLEWSENCVAFHEARHAIKTPSAWQVRRPIYSASCGRWRNYRRHLGPLAEALGRPI